MLEPSKDRQTDSPKATWGLVRTFPTDHLIFFREGVMQMKIRTIALIASAAAIVLVWPIAASAQGENTALEHPSVAADGWYRGKVACNWHRYL